MTLDGISYQQQYTSRVNTFGFLLLAAHLPVLCSIAFFNNGSQLTIVGIMLILLAGPAAIIFQDRSSPLGAIALAVSSMGISALTIFAANGMIEAHFEIFVLLAMLAVFGRIAPLLIAATTIALHHVIFWIWLPTGIFNYKASFGIVLLHAFFVILEVVPCCWMAMQFGRAIESQSIVLESLQDSADQISSAVAEISSSSVSLAQGASQQAASIEETSASTTEISSKAQRNTDNSKAAAELVSESDAQFARTDASLSQMVGAMDAINESSEQISKIVKVIDQIAFQTNILALNASVEAARAGEAGLGFAVVADEVRSLAQRSAAAAKDTANLINDSIEKSKAGMLIVDQVASAIRSTTKDVSKIKDLVIQINSGSREQSAGINQISQAIHRMESVTQAAAAASEETVYATEELTNQSERIREIVRKLTVLSGGAAV